LSRLVELDGDIFAVRHLTKIWKIRTYNGHSVGTCQVCDAATTSGRRIRHHRNRGTLENIWQAILIQIAGKLHSRIVSPLFLDRLNITGSLWMVPAGNDQFDVRQPRCHLLERVDHQFKPFVSSPFAECKNAMLRIAAPRKIRRLRPRGQDAVRSNVNVVTTILLVQYFAVSRHEHGNGIGKQKDSCCNGARHPICTRVPNSGILQIHRVHEMVQGDVGITTRQSGQ